MEVGSYRSLMELVLHFVGMGSNLELNNAMTAIPMIMMDAHQHAQTRLVMSVAHATGGWLLG